MTSPTLQVWWYVNITLKNKLDASTTTYNFSNRPLLGEATGAYWPLLKNLGNLGVRMGNYLPEGTRATVTLDNSPNTFGYERKFSDLLERYTIIDQPIIIYGAQTVTAELNPVPSWAQIWKAKIISWSIDANRNDPELRLDIANDLIPRRIVTKVIESSQFPSAPTDSLGKSLPIVFGESIEVKAIQIAANGDSSPEYAYATTFEDEFVVGGVQTFYAKDRNGYHKAVTTAATVTTEVYGDDLNGLSFDDDDAHTSNELLQDDYWAVDISWASNKAHIITQGYVYFHEADAATIYGSYIFELWEKDLNNGGPGVLVGQAKVEKEDITHSTTAANKIEFAFDTPVVLSSSNGYFFAVKQQANNSSANVWTARYVSSGTREFWKFSNSSWAKWVNIADGNPNKVWWALFGCKLTDDVTPSGAEVNSEGLGHAYFEVTQKTALSHVANPDLTSLDFILSINGLKDNGSGSITGSANAVIKGPRYALLLLDRQWNGSAWVAGEIDTTESTSTHIRQTSTDYYNRQLAGATEGEKGLLELYNEICRNSGCKIYLFNGASKQLAIYGWGSNISSRWNKPLVKLAIKKSPRS